MKKVTTIAMMILMTVTIAAAQSGSSVSGTYYGTSNGVDVVCQVNQNGDQISGVLKDDASTYVFSGSYSGGYSKGKVVADNYYQFAYAASFSAGNMTATITGQGGSITVYLSKNKPASNNSYASSSTPAGNLDKAVVGTWVKESVISSSGYGDYASFVSTTYYQFNANGTFSITDGESAGGGNNWSYSGNGGSGTYGKWYTQNGYLFTIENDGTYSRKYTMHNGQLVFGTSGNYSFLDRAN